MSPLSSLDHFDIQTTDKDVYFFTSDKGTKYYVTFTVYSDLLGVDFPVYNISLYRHLPPGIKIKSDGEKARNTVLIILSKFFSKNQNCLVSVFEESDNRQEVRKRLFIKWIFQLKDYFDLSIHEGEYEYDDIVSHCLLVYTNENENITQLHECFEELKK